MDQDKLRRLEAFLLERREIPFEWGKNDCCLFVADAVRELHNIDFAENFRGYKTKFGAMRRLYAYGGLEKLVDSMLITINRFAAQRGDVILFPSTGGDALGLCVGRVFASAGPAGVKFLSMAYAKKAWICRQR
jgi:hypothetical protein